MLKENKLLKQIEELKNEIKSLKKRKKYGLVWEDKPEQVVLDCQNKLPILKEVKTREIKTDKDKPVNILIEGDNYHSLSVLNYTHRENIDIIYIDPPYNTGSESFIYNDNRYNNVKIDDPYRHSKWISLMNKRLRLAKELLSDKGSVFISIDDNEIAQLKLLCDEIFGENNFISLIPRVTSFQRAGQENYMNISHDYIICYSYANDFSNNTERIKKYNTIIKKDNIGTYIQGDTKALLAALSQGYSKGGDYDFKYNGKVYKPITKEGKRNRWLWTKKRMEAAAELGILVETKNTLRMQIYLDKKFEEKTNTMVNKNDKLIFHTADFMFEKKYTNVWGTSILNNILGNNKFNNPKPIDLIKKLINFSINRDITVLDFFAGSGTTGHAVLELNKEDGGNRKFILCTNNENKIAEEICYPRVSKVIKGYKNKKGDKVEGLGGNLKYYKTGFVDSEHINKISDDSKIKLTYQAGEMIALREDTLDEIEKNEWWQIFTDGEKQTAIYFKEDKLKLKKLIEKLSKNKKSVLYIFSWGKNEYKNEFSEQKNIRIEDIPEPILEVYKELNKL